MVIENQNNEIIGTLQLSFIQYLTYQGRIRAQIEAVRIREDQRGKELASNYFYGPSKDQKKEALIFSN